MAESSWPGAGPATVDEHDFERLMSAWHSSGLVTDSGALPSPADLIYADSTGLQVKARSNRRAQVRGFTWDSGTPDPVLSIGANASGQTRVDRVVLRLDRSTWQVRLAVTAGTPGAGAPGVTRDSGPTGLWDLELADVTVVNGAATINPGDVFAWQRYLMPQGVVADDGFGAGAGATIFLRYAPNDDELWFHRPGGRITIHRDLGWSTLSGGVSGWSVSTTTDIRLYNGVAYLRGGSFQRTGGSISTNTDFRLPGTIPTSMRDPSRVHRLTARVTNDHSAAQVQVYPANSSDRAGQIWVINHPGISTNHFVALTDISWPIGG